VGCSKESAWVTTRKKDVLRLPYRGTYRRIVATSHGICVLPHPQYTPTTTTIFRRTDLKIGASESSHRALHSHPNEIPRCFFNMPESALQRVGVSGGAELEGPGPRLLAIFLTCYVDVAFVEQRGVGVSRWSAVFFGGVQGSTKIRKCKQRT
jgi:hypothetical protein